MVKPLRPSQPLIDIPPLCWILPGKIFVPVRPWWEIPSGCEYLGMATQNLFFRNIKIDALFSVIRAREKKQPHLCFLFTKPPHFFNLICLLFIFVRPYYFKVIVWAFFTHKWRKLYDHSRFNSYHLLFQFPMKMMEFYSANQARPRGEIFLLETLRKNTEKRPHIVPFSPSVQTAKIWFLKSLPKAKLNLMTRYVWRELWPKLPTCVPYSYLTTW